MSGVSCYAAEVIFCKRAVDCAAVYRTDVLLPANLTAGTATFVLNVTHIGSGYGIDIASHDFFTPGATYFARLVHRAYGHDPVTDWTQQFGSQWDDPVTKVIDTSSSVPLSDSCLLIGGAQVSYKGLNWFTAPS